MDALRCQSCGRPLPERARDRGTQANGSPSADFCPTCYRDGRWVRPDLQLEDMIQMSIEAMIQKDRMGSDKAVRIAMATIPNLKRWQEAEAVGA